MDRVSCNEREFNMKSSAMTARVNPLKEVWSKPIVSVFRPTKEALQLILRQNNIEVGPDDTAEILLARAKQLKK